MAYKIELQSIEFKPRENYRIARAVWRISRDGRQDFELPVEAFIAPDADEADAIKYARAVLHSLTTQLADQTKEWALP
ncbi:hypothetical protein [Brevundimonas sp. CEF1]|uniref:hypothetical protein n=1 Tax=Brevundimonas sp. CEF1 TaxID=3442642 RepID=UPI003F514F2F